MKKRALITTLAAIAAAAILPVALPTAAYAEEPQTIATEIFLPTSYLQYYNLDKPYAICRHSGANGEFVAISHQGRIVLYKDEKFRSIDISHLSSGEGVPNLAIYDKFLLFSVDNKLYSVDISENSSFAVTQVSGIDCSYFSINGDKLVVSTNTHLRFYDIPSLSDEFTATEDAAAKKQINGVTTLLLAKDGSVYFSIQNYNVYKLEGDLPRLMRDVSGVKSLAENADATDDKIYYSYAGGISAFSPSDSDNATVICAKSTVTDGEEKDLGKIYAPQGICITEGKLWVVDTDIKAVQEINLQTNAFTDFAITTNSKAINRLSAKASDITVDEDKIYALDDDRIVRINVDENGGKTYDRIVLPSPAYRFSAGGGYVVYSTDPDHDGSNKNFINVGKAEHIEGENEHIFGITDARKYDIGGIAADVCFADGYFYSITTIGVADKKASITRIAAGRTEDERYDYEPISVNSDQSALQIAVDIFGTIYYALDNGTTYTFCSYNGETATTLIEKPHSSAMKLKNIQTDFDGKIFALYENGEKSIVECYDGSEQVYSKELGISDNLKIDGNSIGAAKSMCLSCDSEKAYFVFGGLILTLGEDVDMGITTPRKILVPEDFAIAYSSARTYAPMRDGAKAFLVNIPQNFDTYFDFAEYSSIDESDAGQLFAIFGINSKYSIAARYKKAAIVRNSDIAAPEKTVEETSSSAYAIVGFDTYAIPVLERKYKSGLSVGANERITVTGTMEFNGAVYSVVEKDGKSGFIPESFLAESISAKDDGSLIESAYVWKRGGVDVYIDDLKSDVKDKIDERLQVAVLGRSDNGMVYIAYTKDGASKTGYVDDAYVMKNNRVDLMKFLAVILLAVSAFATTLFFEYKFLFRKVI